MGYLVDVRISASEKYLPVLWLKFKRDYQLFFSFLVFSHFCLFLISFFQLEIYESWFFIALVARNYCFTIRKNVEWLLAAKLSGRLISRNLTWLPFSLMVPRGLNRLNLTKKKNYCNSSIFSYQANFARSSAGTESTV